MNRLKSLRTALVTFSIVSCSVGLFPVSASLQADAAQMKHPTKILYLTFDDGPSYVYTPEILDILRREHIKATFFVVGDRAQQLPKVMERTCREGHEIENHGYYHPSREVLSEEHENHLIIGDIKKTDELVRKLCGKKPRYYRPPGGVINASEIKQIEQLGYHVALWSVDSEDWKACSSEQIVTNVTENAKPGSVILFHDGVSNSRYTVKALPSIIAYYRSRGYSFQTLSSRRP